ncbi:MAG: hypothetical protein HY262_10940 [Chloroflexi bacterium]|nr:hypothetical protein [Chloroflexota bacterium]
MSQPETEDLLDRLGELEGRIAEVEARQEEPGVGSLVRRLVPPEARRHLRAARKEQLLATRAFIDHWIDRLDREAAPRTHRPERIELE